MGVNIPNGLELQLGRKSLVFPSLSRVKIQLILINTLKFCVARKIMRVLAKAKRTQFTHAFTIFFLSLLSCITIHKQFLFSHTCHQHMTLIIILPLFVIHTHYLIIYVCMIHTSHQIFILLLRIIQCLCNRLLHSTLFTCEMNALCSEGFVNRSAKLSLLPS